MDVFHCSIGFNLLCKEGTSNPAFCVRFESQPQLKWHNVINKWLVYIFQKLLPYILNIKGSFWTTWAASYTYPHIIPPPLQCREATPNLVFCVQFESQPQRK